MPDHNEPRDSRMIKKILENTSIDNRGILEPEFLLDVDPILLTPSQLAEAKWLFSGPMNWIMAASPEEVDSLLTMDHPAALLPEVCVIGRSNAGKSSLLNAVLHSSSALKVSSRPGTTQAVHMLVLRDRVRLVDLPGYGYAKMGRDHHTRLSGILQRYLGIVEKTKKNKGKATAKARATLRLVCLLVDSRRALDGVLGSGDKSIDKKSEKLEEKQLLETLDDLGPPYMIILTKADKLKPQELEKAKAMVTESLKFHPLAYPEVLVTSSSTGMGLDRLRALMFLATSTVEEVAVPEKVTPTKRKPKMEE